MNHDLEGALSGFPIGNKAKICEAKNIFAIMINRKTKKKGKKIYASRPVMNMLRCKPTEAALRLSMLTRMGAQIPNWSLHRGSIPASASQLRRVQVVGLFAHQHCVPNSQAGQS